MVKSIEYRKTKKQDVNLSKTQEEVFILITKGDPLDDTNTPLSVKQIANKRKVTEQAVRKTINQLKKKGIIKVMGSIDKANKKLIDEMISKGYIWRVHGYNFSIDILEFLDGYYYSQYNDKSTQSIDNNNIKLEKKSITFYCKKDFWGKDVDGAMWEVQEYVNNIITKLEHKYKIILRKPNKLKMKEFRLHLANVNDPAAKYFLEQGVHINIKDKNGFLEMHCDNSFIPETEFTHKNKGVAQAKEYERHFKDIIEKTGSFTQSELTHKCIKLEEENQCMKNIIIEMSKNINIFIESSTENQKSIKNFIDMNNLLLKSKELEKKEIEDNFKDLGEYFN